MYSKVNSVCSKIEKLTLGIKQSPNSVAGVETEKVYSPTSVVKEEGIETSIEFSTNKKSVKATKVELDGNKIEKVALSKLEISEEPITTETELEPSQALSTDGTTLTPQFCDKLANATKMQNKNVNIFLHKIIK